MRLPILLLLLAFSTCIVAQSTLFYEITSATGEITIDGTPNEAAWATATIATDFQLTQPTDGKPASERTEVKMLFDDRFLYDNPFIRVSLGMAWRFFEEAEVPWKKEPPAVVIVVIGGLFLQTVWDQTPVSVVISVVIQLSSVVIICAPA